MQSIRRNDARRIEVDVIVVDNGSTDDSADVARAAGATVVDGAGCSVAELRNRGAAAARGDIIAFVDSDHQLGTQWVAAAVDCLSAPQVGAAGALCTAPRDGTWVQHWYDRLRDRRTGRHHVDWLGAGNMAIRRSLFERLGGFDRSLETCEDVDLSQRIRAAGYRILSDDQISSTHFGDPATLRAVFFGELWRGRDNLRVTFRGPRTMRHWRSAIIPMAEVLAFVAIAIGAAAMSAAGALLIVAGAAAIAGLTFARARVMMRRGPSTFKGAASALAVAVAYDAGRACALLARAPHRVRRA